MGLFLIVGCSHKLAKTARNCRHTDTEFRCVELTRVYDGDTIHFRIPRIHSLFQKMAIRVAGIQVPELRGGKGACEKERALEAKAFVQGELSGAYRIDLTDCKFGKFARLLCKVKYDGKDLTRELLHRGYGYSYFGEQKKTIDWCNFE